MEEKDKLELPREATNYILKLLAKQPYEQVAQLIEDIARQIRDQEKK